MRKMTSVALILALVLAITGGLFDDLGRANPNPFPIFGFHQGDVSAPANAIPPKISFLNPGNNSLLSASNVSCAIKVRVSGSNVTYTWHGSKLNVSPIINSVYSKVDLQADNTMIYEYTPNHPRNTPPNERYMEYSFSLNFTGISDGNHSVTVYANEWRPYQHNGSISSMWYLVDYNGYNITGYSMLNFKVDTTPPNICILDLENASYNVPNVVPLNFTVNEPVTSISYSLDNQQNVTLWGNTTLASLPSGVHNVTVYAWDDAGNLGVSKTTVFHILHPFPVAPIASVSAATLVLSEH